MQRLSLLPLLQAASPRVQESEEGLQQSHTIGMKSMSYSLNRLYCCARGFFLIVVHFVFLLCLRFLSVDQTGERSPSSLPPPTGGHIILADRGTCPLLQAPSPKSFLLKFLACTVKKIGEGMARKGRLKKKALSGTYPVLSISLSRSPYKLISAPTLFALPGTPPFYSTTVKKERERNARGRRRAIGADVFWEQKLKALAAR